VADETKGEPRGELGGYLARKKSKRRKTTKAQEDDEGAGEARRTIEEGADSIGRESARIHRKGEAGR
jgi:hypothetical protein